MNIELEIEKSLISCIVSRKGGVPVDEINDDFKALTGYSIPFFSLGFPSLLAFLSGIKEVYFVQDENNNAVLIVDGSKSRYMKKLVEKQKPIKRKRDYLNYDHDYTNDLDYTVSSIQSKSSITNYFSAPKRRKATLLKKETMDILTPIMYGYQLMGDDIFLQIAENHLMVSVCNTAPKRCGLCITGQTIKDLIDNIDEQRVLPYRIAILIGLSDLLNDKKASEMINDMDLLISELKCRNINATIFTLPKLSCIPKYFYSRMRTFNNYIISREDETQGIKIMDLNQYYSWMNTCTNCRLSKKYENLLNKTETHVILCGLQDHFCMIHEE